LQAKIKPIYNPFLPFFSELVVMQVAILILFFLDAIREMQKYSSEEQHQQTVEWWVVNM
jgi:hypothetical protein